MVKLLKAESTIEITGKQTTIEGYLINFCFSVGI